METIEHLEAIVAELQHIAELRRQALDAAARGDRETMRKLREELHALELKSVCYVGDGYAA